MSENVLTGMNCDFIMHPLITAFFKGCRTAEVSFSIVCSLLSQREFKHVERGREMSTEPLKLPEVPFGSYSVSRLIVGGNPPHGGSHQTHLMNMHMAEYFTLDQTVELLRHCRAQGINTWQTAYSERVRDVLTRCREEDVEMGFICLCSPDQIADANKFVKVLELKPMGVAFHGEVTDMLWREGKINTVIDALAQIRDVGLLVGLSTHNPEVIEYTEEKGWDIDFYMACVYRESRDHKELMEIMREVPIGEMYLPSDVPKMCETISKATKTCLAFKILAAGRTCDTPEQVREAFEFVLGHIKPTDAVIVGMYPRYTDQVKENADLVRMYG
jgi:hypothetical protein